MQFDLRKAAARVWSATVLTAVVLVASWWAMRPLAAQVTASDYARAERMLGWNASKLITDWPVSPEWIEDGDRFWYRKQVPAGHEFIYVDAARNEQRPAFDHVRLAAALSAASGNSYEAYRLPFEEIELLDDAGTMRFWEKLQKPKNAEAGDEDDDGEESERQEDAEGDSEDEADDGEDGPHRRWTCTLSDYSCSGPLDIAPDADDEVESPDGRWVAFARDENLWVRELSSGEERQLSSDGEEHWGYAAIGQGCCSEITSRRRKTKREPPIFWSPDSRKLATTRLDEREVQEMHLLETHEGRPILHSYRYALPGDEAVPTYSLQVFDLESGRQTAIESPPIELFWPGEEDVRFTADGATLFFVHLHRGFQKAEVYRADAASGESRVLFDENSSTFIELNMTYTELPDWRVTEDGTRLIWRSERDGWGHFYLYDATTGQLLDRMTSGPWSAARIAHVDEQDRWLFFHGYGREPGLNPYTAQLYRVRFDGSGLERLLPEDAHHEVSMSDSGRFIVDTHSRRETPPVSVLRRADGTVVRTLEQAGINQLEEAGWSPPQPFVVKARDGITSLYGLLYRPSNFDPERKYPLIDYIYPGPQIGSIRTWGFSASPAGWTQALAELGFVVMQVNAMGTPYRSKSFHSAWYGDMGDNGLIDHVQAIKQLAARHPEIDLERVGIYGHSGGGFSSTDAMLRFPDFFKVAVSGAGNHDQRSYSYGWGEQYHGLLKKNGKGDNYESQANHRLADRLKGKLLLTYGTLDDNVHPNATQLLIEELIEHNKDFDMLALPNRNHGYSREPYVVRRTWDYFVRHLLGEEPPREYKIEAPPD